LKIIEILEFVWKSWRIIENLWKFMISMIFNYFHAKSLDFQGGGEENMQKCNTKKKVSCFSFCLKLPA